MSELTAKERLQEMLGSFTAGTVPHLLAEVIRADAEQSSNGLASEPGRLIEAALFVVGLGIDAALPR